MVESRPNETATPEPEVGKLEGRFAPAARQRITDYLHSFRSFEPTLVLLYGNSGGTEPGSWSLQAISKSMLVDLIHMYSGFGAVICFDLDGIRVVVPQLSHIEELDNGALDFQGDRLISITADAE
jgi:hypothetical protein